MMKIPFYRPYSKDLHIDEIKDVINNPYGQKVEKLEKEFSKFICTEHAISVLNNSLAMHLALCSIDLKRGDKIICPINSHPSITESIRQFDAEPIFCDILLDDYIIDPNKLEELCQKHKSKKLRAIVVNHFGGKPANLSIYKEIAQRYELRVIEDATFALGSTLDNKKIGCCSLDIAIFSLEPEFAGSISNCAFLATNNDELDDRARLMRNHAMKYQNTNLQIYDVLDIGCKMDISKIDAAYSLATLKLIEEKIARQNEIARIYKQELGDITKISLPVYSSGRTFWLYVIKVEKNRDAFAKELMDEGVSCAVHFVPLNLTAYYKNKYDLKVNEFPNALKAFQQILSLPMYADLKDEEVYFVCEKIKKIAKHWV